MFVEEEGKETYLGKRSEKNLFLFFFLFSTAADSRFRREMMEVSYSVIDDYANCFIFGVLDTIEPSAPTDDDSFEWFIILVEEYCIGVR